MTRPDTYNTVSRIGSPFEGAMALIAEIIRERPNLDGGLCTGNPAGAYEIADAAKDPRTIEGREAVQKMRAMCAQCPVREQCPDRADVQRALTRRPRSPQGRQLNGGRCKRGHLVEGPNLGSGDDCRACNRARSWGRRRNIPAADPRITQIAQKQYLDIMKDHLLGGTA